MTTKRLYSLFVALWLSWLFVFIPASHPPAVPTLAEVMPRHWIVEWAPEPITRLDRFIRQFGRDAATRREIIRETWISSRVIWEHPVTRPLFDRPEEPVYFLVSQDGAESECNPNAISPQNADGSRDLGLTQQNSRYLSRRRITDWRDVGQQTRAQALFMCSLLQASSRFGGDRAIRAAVGGYTAGPVWARRGVVPDIGRTRAHTSKIMRYYQGLRGPEIKPAPAPKPGARIYIVRPGDTLWRIAAAHGTTVQELARRNGIADPDLIRVGERLVIP